MEPRDTLALELEILALMTLTGWDGRRALDVVRRRALADSCAPLDTVRRLNRQAAAGMLPARLRDPLP
jgi:hypothetical protein